VNVVQWTKVIQKATSKNKEVEKFKFGTKKLIFSIFG
jgi:hypothetical protein